MTVDTVFSKLIYLDLTGVVFTASRVWSAVVLPSTLRTLILRDCDILTLKETLDAVSYTNFTMLDLGLNTLSLHTVEAVARNAVHLTSLKMPRKHKINVSSRYCERLICGYASPFIQKSFNLSGQT